MKTKVSIHSTELELDSVVDSNSEGTSSIELYVPDNWNINAATYTKQKWFSNVRHKVNYVKEKRDELSGLATSFNEMRDYSSFAFRVRRYLKLADYAKTEKKCIKIYERISPVLTTFQMGEREVNTLKVDNLITWQLEQSILRNSKRLKSKALMDMADTVHNYREAQFFQTNYSDDSSINELRRLRRYYEKYVMLEEDSQTVLGGVRKHFAYSCAAALAMASSVAIAFKAQEVYGNASVYLFVIFVVGYIFKDRFKEVFRAWMYDVMDKGKYQIKTNYADYYGQKVLNTKQLFEFNTSDSKVVNPDKGFDVSTYPMESLRYKFNIKASKLDKTTRVRVLTKIDLKHLLSKAPRSKVISHWKKNGKIKSGNVKVTYWMYLVLKTESESKTYRLEVSNNKIESHQKLN